MTIETRYDEERGCGWRKPGGLYLVCNGPARACGKLPCPLDLCPTCGAGIAFTRGWTWVDADKLFMKRPCQGNRDTIWAKARAFLDTGSACGDCPLQTQLLGKAGLLWIGEQFYKTPGDFIAEADRLGVSRRIGAIPRQFEIGKTWVLLAHSRAIRRECSPCLRIIVEGTEGAPSKKCKSCKGTGIAWEPGIFRMFKPTAIEYVVKDTDEENKLNQMILRGITPVQVERAIPTHPAAVTP